MKEKKPKVMLGVVEIEGGLWELRNALRKLGMQVDTVIYQKHPFYNDLPYDICYPVQRDKLIGFIKVIPITLKLIFKYDIFFFMFGQSFFPKNLDIFLLKLLRKKIVVFFCGCDIRCREEVLKEDRPYSVCQECDSPCDAKAKRKLVKLWEKYADLIYSDPEQSQLLSRPYIHTKLMLDLDYWKSFKSNIPRDSNKVLIVHAPSVRMVKGTEHVIEAVDRLKSEGYNIELALLESLSNDEVREWLNASDIVVDQLLGGWYGRLAIEAMALSKPTLCYIDEKIKAMMSYGNNLPIVNSNPANVYEDLKLLIENPALRKEIGLKSRTYVEATHSQDVVAAEFKKHLESLLNKERRNII